MISATNPVIAADLRIYPRGYTMSSVNEPNVAGVGPGHARKGGTVSLINFMSSSVGHRARALAGIALIVIGLVIGGGWMALSVIGLIPLLAGAFNVCLLAPFMGQPLKGH